MNKFIKVLIILISINSCDYPELVFDEIVFEDDFETNLKSSYDGYKVSDFNNSKVLGPFNKDGVTIHISDIPEHNYIFVSFDLLIHGSWDGNHNGFPENDRADKWIFELRPNMDLYQNGDFDKYVQLFLIAHATLIGVKDNRIRTVSV